MFEEEEEISGIEYVLQALAGLFIGLIGSAVVMVIVFLAVVTMLGRIAGGPGAWVGEILDIALLGFVGYLIFLRMDRSAMSRGILIGMSIAFLLNAICGVGALT